MLSFNLISSLPFIFNSLENFSMVGVRINIFLLGSRCLIRKKCRHLHLETLWNLWSLKKWAPNQCNFCLRYHILLSGGCKGTKCRFTALVSGYTCQGAFQPCWFTSCLLLCKKCALEVSVQNVQRTMRNKGEGKGLVRK